MFERFLCVLIGTIIGACLIAACYSEPSRTYQPVIVDGQLLYVLKSATPGGD